MKRFQQTVDLLSVVQTRRQRGRLVMEFFQQVLSENFADNKSRPPLSPEPIP
ncbi:MULTISPECIES: hypothetical protein [unclassified Coleofasciculus]|uniref:hypothetical protein n=1 Tax=unclassified Coleofasciculus TaxID=2692782 RepID=UPI001882DFCD|nr:MULTISPECIES: hypothetical protein [unclassified Coleofasciculus]MBE9128187.1 hypothetical protein [Coleofasciculus sp. LEGE 07081]MBE9151257.1 hypothetical protein [Coleofasciculus sp. LEGE 07092]